MGQTVKRAYLGSFIHITHKEETYHEDFQEKWFYDTEFFDRPTKNKFELISLEDGEQSLLMAEDKKYHQLYGHGDDFHSEGDKIITEFTTEKLVVFEADFKDFIAKLTQEFPDTKVHYGFVSFWDRIG